MFVHLRCHSHYSFLRAVPRPEELVAAAAEQARLETSALPDSLRGGAVALTDTNGLYAAVPFYKKAKEAGVKPIVGAVLDISLDAVPSAALAAPRAVGADLQIRPPATSLECGGLFTLSSQPANEGPPLCLTRAEGHAFSPECKPGACKLPYSTQLLLLAENFSGYSNLCQLVTTRHLHERPVTLEELNQHRAGLIALAQIGRGGPVPALSGGEGCPPARSNTEACSREKEHIACLKKIFPGALYLEAQRLWPGDGRQLRHTLRLAEHLGLPVVATNGVHFLRPEEHLHHRVLNAVRTGTLLSTVARPEITSSEAYFKSAAEMQRAFPDHPELLRNSLAIAERCNLDLPLGATIFPEFPTPPGETPFSYLWKLCFAGAQRRYQPLTPPVLARLTHELEVIEKLNLAPYFLLVWDIVEEARRRGIPAVARGSAASSMVTYCLGISRVCPLRWGLYFERFLNQQRGDIPDIDLDICGARRDELLDYVYTRWGQAHVAMIASFVTMHARLAVREVAKVFGVAPAEVNRFTRRLPHRPVREILQALRTLPECRSLPAADEPWKTILDVALRLDDFPRHLGIHPCGTVIAAQPLTRLVPLEVATKGIVVTQYDMHAVEALGLIKMDLLGQRGLTTMSLALENIEKRNATIETRNSQLENRNCQPATRAVAGAGQREPAAGSHVARSHARHPEPAVAGEGSAFEISNFKSEIPAPGQWPKADSSPRPKSTGPGMKSDISLPPASAQPNFDFRFSNFDAIPEADPQACAMIAAGRTLGIFQIESPGMRGLLRALRATTLDDICLALALIRPGAAEYGAKESFLRRLAGRKPVRYPHPRTEPILRETLGICVYQEQVMQLAQAAGEFSLAEADLARRAAAKFADRRERERLHAKFLKAAERLGLDAAARDETWHMVEKFAGFGFCKAHAATYADLSYRIAWLKAHYPAEFLAAMCSSGAGFYHVSAYVEEAKRWGIAVLLPSVNHSRCEYTTEPVLETPMEWPVAQTSVTQAPVAQASVAQASSLCVDGSLKMPSGGRSFSSDNGQAALERASAPEATALRIGLMQVKGLRAETIAAIVRNREQHGPYRSLEDFLARMPVERDEIESLIKCGAFDDVGQVSRPVPVQPPPVSCDQGRTGLQVCPTRAALLWRLNLALARRGAQAQRAAAAGESLFPEAAPGREADGLDPAAPSFPAADYTREQRLRYEQEILEVCVSGHPLDRFPRNGEVWSTDVLQAADALQAARAERASFRAAQPQPPRHLSPAAMRHATHSPTCHPELAVAGEGSAFLHAPAAPPLRSRALLIGQRVSLLGWVITFRRVGTKNYRNMMFVTCEDQRGIYEVVLFPPAYETYGGLVFETRLLRVTGRVEPGGQINCEKLELLRV